jgi:hypothetical protein
MSIKRNELKKYLYKYKPLATLDCVSKKGIVYILKTESGLVYFLVPLSDIGDGTFNHEMQAQLLIRYIYE